MSERDEDPGESRGRLHAMSGDVLRTAPDPVLQTLVEEAARRLDVPISLVSLVLDTIQFFRAHHGLPPELAAVRATSRASAFAQKVMDHGEALAIDDLQDAPEMPQEHAERYGLRGYLGAPVRIDGEVSGALEVMDHAPRAWRAADAARLTAFAERVGRRLDVLAERRRTDNPVEPLIEALHGELMPLQLAVIEARVAAVELGVLSTLIEEASGGERAGSVPDALKTVRLLRDRLDRANQASGRIIDSFDHLRRQLLGARASVALERLTVGAEAVTRPLTDQVGGVQWRLPIRPCAVAVPESTGIALIATALLTLAGLMLARAEPSPLQAWTELDEGVVRIIFGSPKIDHQDGLMVAAALSRLGADQSTARVELGGVGFCLLLPMGA